MTQPETMAKAIYEGVREHETRYGSLGAIMPEWDEASTDIRAAFVEAVDRALNMGIIARPHIEPLPRHRGFEQS